MEIQTKCVCGIIISSSGSFKTDKKRKYKSAQSIKDLQISKCNSWSKKLHLYRSSLLLKRCKAFVSLKLQKTGSCVYLIKTATASSANTLQKKKKRVYTPDLLHHLPPLLPLCVLQSPQ